MYNEYFGLSEAPFSIAVNPRYLFLSARHKEALAHLLYGVAGGGFVLLTGEVGTGKTTLNRYFLSQLPDKTDVAIINNPSLSCEEFLAAACEAFGLALPEVNSLKSLTDTLHHFLEDNHSVGRRSILMVDEAQHLALDVLEQVRLLTNLETDTQKLLQIVLIGQPELMAKLNKPELRQLNQRITGRYKLGALSLEETRQYVEHRLAVAGMAPGVSPFSKSSIQTIHEKTGGVPRLINLLCDRILLALFARQKKSADRKIALLAADELWQTDGGVDVLGSRVGASSNAKLKRLIFVALVLAAAGILAVWWKQQTPTAVPGSLKVKETELAPIDRQSVLPTFESKARPLRALWISYEGLGTPCADELRLRCLELADGSWQALAALNRPVLISLVNEFREKSYALVHRVNLIEGQVRSIELLSPEGVIPVDVRRLGALWDGSYLFLWTPPLGFDQALARGVKSPVVTQVALDFAKLDGAPRPLAQNEFNRLLHERVVAFQAQNGLSTDGVVGRETLIALEAELNSAPGVAAIVAALEAD